MSLPTLRLQAVLQGQRVIAPDTVRAVSDLRALQQQLHAERQVLRQRIASRLRRQRQRAAQAARVQRLMAAGYAFARDHATWQRWRESLRVALEQAVAEVGLALPRDALLQKQVEKAVCLAAHSTGPLTVHVHTRTEATLRQMLATLCGAGPPLEYAVVITDYLEDDSCIIETPSGLFEAHVGPEVQAFGSGITAYLEEAQRVARGVP